MTETTAKGAIPSLSAAEAEKMQAAFTDIAERSQKLLADFAERYKAEGQAPVDPLNSPDLSIATYRRYRHSAVKQALKSVTSDDLAGACHRVPFRVRGSIHSDGAPDVHPGLMGWDCSLGPPVSEKMRSI